MHQLLLADYLLLAVARELGCMKWLKNEARKSLYFMQLFLHYIHFGKNFIG